MKQNGAKLRDFPEKNIVNFVKKMSLPTNSNFLVCHTISVQIVGMQHDVKIENETISTALLAILQVMTPQHTQLLQLPDIRGFDLAII